MEERQNKKIRQIQAGEWFWMNKAVLRDYGSKLKASGIAVYNVLALYSNSSTQSCFPTQQSIAVLIGANRRTVARKIRLLKQLGLIDVEKKRGRCGYLLLLPKMI